ncbi:hypothetical protein L6Q21_13560, partial [Sandaracinobacter sp. RS1-74]|nr:hypothetical protein [Sandaracinobacteroides sayramensis]
HSSPSDELTYQWHDFWGAGQGVDSVRETTAASREQSHYSPNHTITPHEKCGKACGISLQYLLNYRANSTQYTT